MTGTILQPYIKMMKRILPMLNKLLKLAISMIYEKRTHIIHEKELGKERKKITIGENGVEFVKIENVDDAIYLSLRKCNPYLSKKVFNYEVRNGHRCFVGIKNGEIIFSVWTRGYKGKGLDDSKYPITSKKEIHFFSAVTKKDYRGKNIYPAGIQFLEDYHKELGYERMSCATLKEKNGENNSQRGLSKINFMDTGKRIATTRFLFYRRSRQNFTIHFDEIEQEVKM
jgi:hypothetical protein